MARIIELGNPLVDAHLMSLRKSSTSTKECRYAGKKIGEYLGLRIAKDLPDESKTVRTSLGATAEHYILEQQPVIVSILRAGNILHDGLLEAYPEAESGFLGAKRDEVSLQSELFYQALPDITDKCVIVADPMLATAGSMIKSIEAIKERNPAQILVASIFAAQRGIDNLLSYDSSLRIYTAVIDRGRKNGLNVKGYIVPGCGDAGDRFYGKKID